MTHSIRPDYKKSSAVFDTRFKGRLLLPRYWPTWLAIALSYLLFLLPVKLVDKWGAKLGDYVRKGNKKRLKIAETNVSLCYPDKTDKQLDDFVAQHFRAYGRSLLHYGFLFWASRKAVEQRIELHGKEHVEACIEQGHSAIIMTAHSVGLETAVSTFSRHYPLTGPFKEMKNPLINWFVAKRRMRYGAALYSRDAGLRPIIKDVKAGYVMGYLPDEDLGRDQSIFTPFMGVSKATIPVLGRLAKTCKAKVFPVNCCYDEKQGRYHIYILPALDNFPLMDDQVDTLRMNQALEALVDICPEQYFWTLKLFKTRPDGEESIY